MSASRSGPRSCTLTTLRYATISRHVSHLRRSQRAMIVLSILLLYKRSENMRTESFQAKFLPRSDGMRGMIENEAAEAREVISLLHGK